MTVDELARVRRLTGCPSCRELVGFVDLETLLEIHAAAAVAPGAVHDRLVAAIDAERISETELRAMYGDR